jgi:hypothetical protein
VGLGVFSFNPEKVLVSESGIPASYPTTHARVYVDLSNNHNTGLALANPNATAQSVSIGAYLTDGLTSIGTSLGPVQLGPNGHAAMFVDQLIRGLPRDFKGVLDIRSGSPFSAMTIRSLTNERNQFLMTAFPVADPSRSVIAPILFPQIADGGGSSTEFIFLSPSGASNAVVEMFGESGAPTKPEQ